MSFSDRCFCRFWEGFGVHFRKKMRPFGENAISQECVETEGLRECHFVTFFDLVLNSRIIFGLLDANSN